MRFYADGAHYKWEPSNDVSPLIAAPTGITFLGGENPISVSTAQRVEAFRKGPKSALYNLHYLNAHERGGHYGYYENPEAIIHDIRATFKELR